MPNLSDLIASAEEQVAALAAQIAAGGADWQAAASAAGDAPAPARISAAFAAAKQTLAALQKLQQAQDQRLSAYVEGISYAAVGAQRLNDAVGDFGGSLHPRLAGAGLTQAGPSSCALALKQAVAALVDAGMDPNTAHALSRIEPSTVPSGAALRDPANGALLTAITKTIESAAKADELPFGNFPAVQQFGPGGLTMATPREDYCHWLQVAENGVNAAAADALAMQRHGVAMRTKVASVLDAVEYADQARLRLPVDEQAAADATLAAIGPSLLALKAMIPGAKP